jgi:hypothetical protein
MTLVEETPTGNIEARGTVQIPENERRAAPDTQLSS